MNPVSARVLLLLLLLLLLLTSASALHPKFVLVQQPMDWHAARDYCRANHIDLAPVTNWEDHEQIRVLSSSFLWIGMTKCASAGCEWTWSGGGEVTEFFWAPFNPRRHAGFHYGAMYLWGWMDGVPTHSIWSVCFTATVVPERRTWLEALEHCRRHHSDLASVTSPTEMLLLRGKLERDGVAEPVWIGLRFFPDGWLWLDRRPLDYQVWAGGLRPECPRVFTECGALRATGSTPTMASVHCEERHPFICY